MSPKAVLSAVLTGIGPGFTVPVVTGAALLGCAAVAAVRELRTTARHTVVAAYLLGAAGVAGQLVVASSAPASRLGFLFGTVGGWCWYVGWLRSSRWWGLTEQGLAVGGVLWVGGTITLAVSFSGAGWPVRWSLGVGLAAVVGTAVLSRASYEGETASPRVLLATSPVAVAFGGPVAVGGLFGPEIVFVLFLVCVVSALIGWSFVRLEQTE